MQISRPAINLHHRLFWLLLACGLALRCVALTQPLVDAHLLRQCQTAAATLDMWRTPGFALSSHIPWIGDFTESYVLELPIYNFLTMGVNVVAGNLTLSGKLVSVILWAISYFLLQGIWRRMLDPTAAVWANLLFVVSPLGVFFGQAVMPEMLVQALAFGFVLLLARYDEVPTLRRWTACVAVGFTGLLVKTPEIVHLYLLLVVLLMRREAWPAFFRLRYVIAGALSVAGLFAWTRYLNSVNGGSYAFGSAETNLAGFIGPLALRFQVRPWLMIALYLGALVVPGPAVLAVFQGARVFFARPTLLTAAWLGSVAIFYLLWFGNAATAQSYYNLPALAPICALFGLGMKTVLTWSRLSARSPAAAILAVVLTVGCAVPGWLYLFRPDHTILAAARWARDHTEPGTVILCDVHHRPDIAGYGANAVFHYYSDRPTFIWVDGLPEPLRRTALERSRYAVITLPAPAPAGWVGKFQRFRGWQSSPPVSMEWLTQRGFVPAGEGPGFIALRRL